ncbi:COG3520 Predicted component of the type VI protein secretion system [Rhabdaerophilaceae bacterium]
MRDFSRAHEEYTFITLALALEREFPDAPPIGSTSAPGRERIRFRANPSLGFPPSEIQSVGAVDEHARFIDVTINLIGLFGPSSPLPAHVTERVIHAENGALRDFLDFFNHRLAALLFQIWKRYRHAFQYQGGASDEISEAISALFGRYGLGSSSQSSLSPQSLLSLTGLMALGSRSASIASTVLTSLLGVPCRIEEFVLSEFRIPEDDQLQLGKRGLELGRNTIIGEQASSIASHFRLRIGPLEQSGFLELLPDTEGYNRINAALGLMLNDPLSWSVVYELAPGAAPPFVLGGSRMGWSSILPPSEQRLFDVEILA